MSERFLTDEWFDVVVQSAQVACASNPGASQLVVQYETEGPDGVTYHYQVFRDGWLSSWRSGFWSESDVTLRSNAEDLKGLLRGELVPHEAVGAFSVVEMRSGQRTIVKPPPLDVLHNDGFEALPRFEGATVLYNTSLVKSPFGRIDFHQQYVDGQRTSWGFGLHRDATAGFRLNYLNHCRLQLGEITAMEALEENGEAYGEWTELMLVAGLIESPASMKLRRSGCQSGGTLGELGRVMASERYGPVAQALRALVPDARQ